MKHIVWKNVLKKAGNVAVSVFELAYVFGLLHPSPKRKTREPANYGEAVKAIVNSDMLDSYKKEIMGMLSAYGRQEYYEAVIDIVNSDMLDSYKKEMIEQLKAF